MDNSTHSYFSHPFGERSCEQEIKVLKSRYKDLYFIHTPFNEEALNYDNYLFIGRRGAGKTSLAHYFTFQKKKFHQRHVLMLTSQTYMNLCLLAFHNMLHLQVKLQLIEQ